MEIHNQNSQLYRQYEMQHTDQGSTYFHSCHFVSGVAITVNLAVKLISKLYFLDCTSCIKNIRNVIYNTI
jgi:hypothetical protein